MIVTKELLTRFKRYAKSIGEPLFGSNEDIKTQLETAFAVQGYWAGVAKRIFYDQATGEFRNELRY